MFQQDVKSEELPQNKNIQIYKTYRAVNPQSKTIMAGTFFFPMRAQKKNQSPQSKITKDRDGL